MTARWRSTILGAALILAAASPAAARDLPIKSGRWTDAASCADPSARDAANARRFGPGDTSTGHDDCRIAIGEVRGNAYSAHLSCTYVQGGSGEADIVLTVLSRTEIRWRGLDPAFQTTYRFCGSR